MVHAVVFIIHVTVGSLLFLAEELSLEVPGVGERPLALDLLVLCAGSATALTHLATSARTIRAVRASARRRPRGCERRTVVVLQVAAEALELERGPGNVGGDAACESARAVPMSGGDAPVRVLRLCDISSGTHII